MKIYKFRGKRIDNGEYVYGDLIQGDNDVRIRQWSDGTEVEIDNDTIRQLIDYDLNEEEVYEGDVLTFDYNGMHYEYEARLVGQAVEKCGCYLTQSQFKTRELKRND